MTDSGHHSSYMQAFREMLKAESKGDIYNLPPRDQLLGSVSRATPAAALNKVLPLYTVYCIQQKLFVL